MKIYEICRNYLETNPNKETVVRHFTKLLNDINIHHNRIALYAETNSSNPRVPMPLSRAKREYFKKIGMNKMVDEKKAMDFILSDHIVEL